MGNITEVHIHVYTKLFIMQNLHFTLFSIIIVTSKQCSTKLLSYHKLPFGTKREYKLLNVEECVHKSR